MKRLNSFILSSFIMLILFSISSSSFSQPDSLDWIKSEHNPILEGTSGWEWLIRRTYCIKDGEEYKLFYTGYAGGNPHQIGLATSNDGINYTKSASNPVIPRDQQSWSSYRTTVGSFVKIEDTYYAFYTGNNENLNSPASIGLATSDDGENWTLYENNPIILYSEITPGDQTLGDPNVIYKDETFYMYFWQSGLKLIYATSTDAINWDINTETDINLPDDGHYSIRYDGNQYYALQQHNTDTVELWTSNDGTTWTENKQSVLLPYQSWQNNEQSFFSLFLDDNTDSLTVFFSAFWEGKLGLAKAQNIFLEDPEFENMIAWYKFNNNFFNQILHDTVKIETDTTQLSLTNTYLHLINDANNDPRGRIRMYLRTSEINKLTIKSKAYYTTADQYTVSGIKLLDNDNNVLAAKHNNYHFSGNDDDGDYTNREHVYLHNVIHEDGYGNVVEWTVSELLPMDFGQWIEEIIVIDYENNFAYYLHNNLDGSPIDSVFIEDITFSRTDSTIIHINAWDWASGSTHDLDYLKIYAEYDDTPVYVKESNPNLNEIIIFPNPATDIINLQEITGKYKYKIINLTGRILQAGTEKENTINIQNIPVGIYILQITNNNQIFTNKFIKL